MPEMGGAYLTCAAYHDVVAVPVTNAQHVRGHTVASTGQRELLYGTIEGIPTPGEESREIAVRPTGWGVEPEISCCVTSF